MVMEICMLRLHTEQLFQIADTTVRMSDFQRRKHTVQHFIHFLPARHAGTRQD